MIRTLNTILISFIDGVIGKTSSEYGYQEMDNIFDSRYKHGQAGYLKILG
jgi:hypothetical protein